MPWPFRRFHRLVFSNVTNALCVGGSQGLCDEAATDRLSSARVEPHIPWAALWGPMAAMPAIRRLLRRKPARGAEKRHIGASLGQVAGDDADGNSWMCGIRGDSITPRSRVVGAIPPAVSNRGTIGGCMAEKPYAPPYALSVFAGGRGSNAYGR